MLIQVAASIKFAGMKIEKGNLKHTCLQYRISFCKDLLVQKFFVLLIVCNKTFSATYILISNALQISINSQPCDLQKIILEPKIFLLHQLRLHNAIVAIND